MDKDPSSAADAARARNVADAPCIADLLAEAAQLGVAQLDAQLLLQRLSGQSRAQQLAFDDAAVDATTAALFRAAAARAAPRANRWPTSPASANSGRCRWW